MTFETEKQEAGKRNMEIMKKFGFDMTMNLPEHVCQDHRMEKIDAKHSRCRDCGKIWETL